MAVKVELKEFTDREKCKKFVNDFIKDKKLRQTKVLPVINKEGIKYFIYIEYED